MENYQQQPSANSSKIEKPHNFRFSTADKDFLKDYFQNTNKAPRKKERQQILAHIKELGNTEVTDSRIVNWFGYRRREDKMRSLPLSTSTPEPSERKWVNAHHKALWPSLTRKTLKNLELLYAEHITEDEPPYDLWAKGLHAKPEHVLMWCKFKERERGIESAPQSRPDVTPIITSISQATGGHSQLPTPGASTSPEPHRTLVALPPLSPDVVKYEPPASPVVETTRFQPQPDIPVRRSSMGLHAAIESAFSVPLPPPLPSVQPPKPLSATTQISHHRKPSSRNSSRPIDVIPPPAPPPIPSSTSASVSASLPSVSVISPSSNPELSPSLPHHEPSAPPLPEEPIPEPPAQPARDVAQERANLVAGIAEKMDEVTAMFGSVHGLSQLAGSIQGMGRRNKQFLDDVAAGRFAHMRLTSAHLPNRQTPSLSPQPVPTEQRNEKEKGKERAEDDTGMDVD